MTPEYIATEKGWGAVLPAPAKIAQITKCRCWVIYLAQGIAVLPCVLHEPEIVKVIEREPVLPAQ